MIIKEVFFLQTKDLVEIQSDNIFFYQIIILKRMMPFTILVHLRHELFANN